MKSSEPREIERKFLVADDGWRKKATRSTQIVQGYLARGRKATIRIRIKDDRVATLTIKSREPGASRAEFEYRVPIKHGRALLALCGRSISKQRFEVPHGNLKWEIDVFAEPHAGLVLAEIEVRSTATELKLPRWVGAEVTDDPAYRNSALVDGG